MNRIAFAAIAFAALTLAGREAHAGKTTISGSRADWLVQKAAETKADCEAHPDKYPGDDCQKVANFVAAQFAEVFDSCNEASNAIEHCFAKAEAKKAEIEQKAKDRKPKDRKPKPPKTDEKKFKVSLVNSDRVDGSAKDAKEILEKAGIPTGDMLNREQVLTEGSINCHPKHKSLCKKVHKLLKSKWVFQAEWLVDSTNADEVLVYLVLAKSDKGDEADEGEEEETPDEGEGETAEETKPVKPGKKPKGEAKKEEPSEASKWVSDNHQGVNAALRGFKLRAGTDLLQGYLSVPGAEATLYLSGRIGIGYQYDHYDVPVAGGCSLDARLGIGYVGNTDWKMFTHAPLLGSVIGCEILLVPFAFDAFQKRSEDGEIRDGDWSRSFKIGLRFESDLTLAGIGLEKPFQGRFDLVNRGFLSFSPPALHLQFDLPRSVPFPVPGVSFIAELNLLPSLGGKLQLYRQYPWPGWPVQFAIGTPRLFLGMQFYLPDLDSKLR